LPARRALAWDCGTGSGQAAVALARHFGRVVATDASSAQVKAARRAERVCYAAALSEASGLRSGSADLVTVAQALHWFDRDRFYREVRRVLAPGGVLAIWTYGIFRSIPELDRIMDAFYQGTVGPFWPPERILVEQGYRTIDIPIDDVPVPRLEIEADLTLAGVLGFVRTWSAVGRYIAAHQRDPVAALAVELGAAWGDPEVPRRLVWPLGIRAGRLRPERDQSA
jgi:SAM-dependent methyltransferase